MIVSDEEAERIASIFEDNNEELVIRDRDLLEELEDMLDFNEDEYNNTAEDDWASFKEMLQGCLIAAQDNHGTLEDAAFIANDAFRD